MQNLTKCSNRHYFIPGKIVSTSSTLNGTVKFNRLSLLEQYHVQHGMYKKYGMLPSILQEYVVNQHYLLKYANCRKFSTNSVLNKEQKEQKEQKNDENKPPNQDDDDDMRKQALLAILKFTLIGGIIYYTFRKQAEPRSLVTGNGVKYISWQEFVNEMLAKGEVEEIIVYPGFKMAEIRLYPGAIIKGQKVPDLIYALYMPDIEHIEEKLRKVERSLGIQKGYEVSVVYNRSKETIIGLVPVLLIIMLMFMLLKAHSYIQVGIKPFLSQLKKANFTLVHPLTKHGKGIRFEDVAGLKEAKIEIMEFVDYLKNPERYKKLGAKIPKGALLLGPPGCGKTLLAKAVATEANVPFLSMNGSEFVEVIGGLGAARVRDLFKEGKERAPSIIYIDEIDAIGRKRSESGIAQDVSESERTLNQLLVEMDGMISRDDIIVLASTNRARVLDKALLRPGRFDRHILIDLPTQTERKEIFEYHLKKIVLQHEPSKYSNNLAYLTPGFSGADIANVCNEAALYAARHKKKIVDGSDLMYALDRIIGGAKKINNTIPPSMKRVTAYHEAGHALVGWLLPHTNALLKVTIVPRTNAQLGFAQYLDSDKILQTKEELLDTMCVMLAGRAAENLVFNQITSGAQNDLEKVTKLAYRQIQQYGMCPTVGLFSFHEKSTSTTTKKPYSKQLGNLMDAEARRLIAEAYKHAEKVLSENRDKLDKLAEALLEKETLTYDDVKELIGPPPYVKKRLDEPAEFRSSNPALELATVNSVTT